MVKEKKRNASRGPGKPRYELVLYVTGATVRSLRAIANIKAICEEYLKGHYKLDVIDIYRRPEMLHEDQVVAVPTLIRKAPVPTRCLVGDLSKAEQVLTSLDIPAGTP